MESYSSTGNVKSMNNQKTIFKISKMDCPSEESLIRMKLADFSSIQHLDFNLADRTLTVFHTDELQSIDKALHALNLDSQQISTEAIEQIHFEEENNQRKLLWWVLSINFSFFLIEISTGLFSKSMGLVADSLDMLADSFVYGISLLAVGSTVIRKKQVAKIAGYFQLTLAFIGFLEVLRRFLNVEQLPNFSIMIFISVLALIANGVCLYLLQQSKNKNEAHIKASMIFTSNDVIINLGVILAGILVNTFSSSLPDLIIGSIVFVLVCQGAFRILKLSK